MTESYHQTSLMIGFRHGCVLLLFVLGSWSLVWAFWHWPSRWLGYSLLSVSLFCLFLWSSRDWSGHG